MSSQHPTVITDEQAIDGPREPDSFAWQGRVYLGMRPTSWRLVKALWYSPSHAEHLDALARPVFEINYRPERHQSANAATRANQFFRWNSLPFSVRSRAKYMQLIEHPD